MSSWRVNIHYINLPTMSDGLHQYIAESFSDIRVFDSLSDERKELIIAELVAYVKGIRTALSADSSLRRSAIGIGALYKQVVGVGLLTTDASLADLVAILQQNPHFSLEANPEATELGKKVRVFLLDPEQ